MAAPGSGLSSHAGLRCPKCGYDLTGLDRSICPECGNAFDLDELIKNQSRTRRRFRWFAASLITLAYYAPYSWLLFIDYPWSDYRWHWIKMWLGLPLLLPSTFVARQILGLDIDGPAGMIIMIAVSLALLIGLILIARRGTRAMIITAMIVLVISAINAWGCYNAFRM